jgi:hypothetical protein
MADMRAAYKRDGKRVAGRIPFGYRTDPATKQLVVNEEQARRVYDFFALAAGGSRPSDLVGLANLQCWPDQNGETGKWTARRILKLLNNRVYIGKILNGDSTLPGLFREHNPANALKPCSTLPNRTKPNLYSMRETVFDLGQKLHFQLAKAVFGEPI